MDRTNLVTLLGLLRDMRYKMLEEFNNPNTIEIYEPCFEYEDSPREMSLSIEKYFILWLDSHYNEFSNTLHTMADEGGTPPDMEGLKMDFLSVQHSLISLFIKSSFNSDFSRNLLCIKKHELQGFLDVLNRHQDNFDRLNYQQVKHRNLFRREMNRIKKERINNKGEDSSYV